MRIEEQFEVSSPIERVYGELNDISGIGECIAGFKDVQTIDESHSHWKFEQRFGAMAKTFDLDATITERERPERLAFQASGQEVTIDGHVALRQIHAEQTHCEIVMDVEVVGPLAPLVEIFAKGPQKKLIEQTISNLREKLDNAEAAPPTGKPAPPSRLSGWLRRLFGR